MTRTNSDEPMADIYRRKTWALAKEAPRREARRAQRKRERLCFWTWPFGHVLTEDSETDYALGIQCVVCGHWCDR